MSDMIRESRKAGGISGRLGLSKVEKGLALLCLLLTTLIGLYAYRDSVLHSETEISTKNIDDLNALTITDPRAVDKLAFLKIKIGERGCEKHYMLARLDSDFATRMKTLCFMNDLAIKIAQNFERSLPPTAPHATAVRSDVATASKKPAALALPAPEHASTPRSNSPYVLDIFWCESIEGIATENATNQQLAKTAYNLISGTSLVSRVRVRKLPATSLQTNNYYFYYGRGAEAITLPGDTAILNVIKEKLATRGIPLTIFPTTGAADTYLSIFMCFNGRTLNAEDFSGAAAPSATPRPNQIAPP